ncbi:hypothetical protein [Solimicrobium silvestre]|uniref:Uncharacterized protein n=1 Tax=Solimicrobium silvestre TaxID=2099400 RepID=A0A2S9H2I4_9BURK|nr:hypothetical protein [Solimicrobium silvestre]PRC94076.1 hypothetical protein S2091_1249 [Solimicrobium silvestre]
MDKEQTLEISVTGHLIVNDANLALTAALNGAGISFILRAPSNEEPA